MSTPGVYPDLVLSAAQLGVWVAQKLDPTSPIFNLGQYVEIRGTLDPEPSRPRARNAPGKVVTRLQGPKRPGGR